MIDPSMKRMSTLMRRTAIINDDSIKITTKVYRSLTQCITNSQDLTLVIPNEEKILKRVIESNPKGFYYDTKSESYVVEFRPGYELIKIVHEKIGLIDSQKSIVLPLEINFVEELYEDVHKKKILPYQSQDCYLIGHLDHSSDA